MSLTELVDIQIELFWRISRAVENLRKLGEANITTGQVQSRLDALHSIWGKFQNNHEKLRQLKSAYKEEQRETINALPYYKDDYFSRSEEKFYEQKGIMLDALDKLKTTANPPMATTAVAAQALQAVDFAPVATPRRLPPIELPTFSGNYTDWKPFHDLFNSIVRDNRQISDVEKLHYLKTSLTGEPSQLVKNIAITEGNFARAWETLVSRYENKRLLTDSHLSALFGIPRVNKKSSTELKQLYSDTCEALGALEELGSPVDTWDHIIVYMTLRKFDAGSLEEWEKEVSKKTDPPTFLQLKSFLVSRIQTLEAVEQAQNSQGKVTPVQGKQPSSTRSHTAQPRERSCACCKGNHFIAFCPAFKQKSVEQRREIIISNRLCYNCLGSHPVKDCVCEKTCRICHGRHHTTLHRKSASATAPAANTGLPAQTNASQGPQATPSISFDPQVSSHAAHTESMQRSPVLLATAQALVSNPGTVEGITARALLDQGSESSFITESLAQQLRLPRLHASIRVIGVGAQQTGVTRGIVKLQIQSRTEPSFVCRVEALVLPRLTAFLPSFQLLDEDWPHLKGISLADTSFGQPGRIDLILGADTYCHVLKSGIRKGSPGTPMAQETKFGWVVSGSVPRQFTSLADGDVQGFQGSLDHTLLELMQQFWKQEEVPMQTPLTGEEASCEKHFEKTSSRRVGRYVVRLPFKTDQFDLGDSRTPALQMLHRLEKRFAVNPHLRRAYSDFLHEYLSLGHMRRALSAARDSSRAFYLPHHGVVRESSSTTRLRVVFNGSQKTDLGHSLNDHLLVGPKVQTDLADVLLRWRQFPVAFTSDIVKMYRQIMVHEDDWDFQRILWRENPESPIEEYHLTTVTYGLASAPFLANRVLHQLVKDDGQQFPSASQVVLNNMYVDDVLSGAEDTHQAREKINELTQLLKAGGFELQKWTATHPEILAEVGCAQEVIARNLNLDQSPLSRALGLAWNPAADSFVFEPQPLQKQQHLTKRMVLSQTAQLFDPLGWLAPIVIKAKIFMQELWSLGLDWDEPLTDALASRWKQFLQELQSLSTIAIPRWIGISSATPALEIHGFADASQHALGAVVYSRAYVDSHEVRVSLVCAKTKVAPLKKVTIPRLELCAAVLLVRLVRHVEKTLNLANVPIYLWTDSTVALAWIKGHPSRWKDFVSNRVNEIQEFAHARWRHVSGSENPADLASRGGSPETMMQSPLWIAGPPWLGRPSVSWPSSPSQLNEEDLRQEERKQLSAHHAVPKLPTIWDLIERYSSLTRLLRITALCQRATKKFLARRASKPVLDSTTHTGPITTQEMDTARLFWTKIVQQAYFAEEIRQLKASSSVIRNPLFFRLVPLIDNDELIRVGGRLHHSESPYEERHPLILPRESPLTSLIIDHYHRSTLHGGPQLTLATIRQRYWILGGRVPVRSFIRRCVPCARQRATLSVQQMGQLPHNRVTQARPFLNSGVDYAGPFAIRASRIRNSKTFKGYIVLFVCFSTSAVHLEAVTDYTAAGFIAAYTRFTSRRGICATITSDCGTNLVGADAELRRLLTASTKESTQIADTLASLGTQWRFNPPSAPHFGGKWEAGVKSAKFHLKRVVGETELTYEQFATFLTQVEATLNSRPLCAISDDSRDPTALTPGHFLIGAALNTIPEPSLADLPTQRLSHWQHARQMLEHFWKRWSTEYLQQFQTLPKWQAQHGNVQEGSIVLVKDDNLPPSLWPLAKVVTVHPGADGLVRVVTIRTKSSVLKRPIVKLCVLPVMPEMQPPKAGGSASK